MHDRAKGISAPEGLTLIATGAEHCVLISCGSQRLPKEDRLYPCDSLIRHMWKHVSIGVQCEGRAGMSELPRDDFW